MNILVNKLPTKVHINGKEYRVNYGYKAFILIENCFTDNERSNEQKEMDAFSIFYGDDIPEDNAQAFEKLLWFYRCGKKETEEDRQKAVRAEMQHTARAYDFQKDQNLIFSAFMQQYGINLNKTKNEELHWWEFRALFEGLTEPCHLVKVMGYRTMSLKGLKGQQLKHYKEMKRLYSLEETRTVDSKMALAERNARMKAYVKRRVEEE